MDGIVWIVLAYFIGAIPSGYMIGRVFYGVNLKKAVSYTHLTLPTIA